jgi:hypothetical protein
MNYLSNTISIDQNLYKPWVKPAAHDESLLYKWYVFIRGRKNILITNAIVIESRIGRRLIAVSPKYRECVFEREPREQSLEETTQQTGV